MSDKDRSTKAAARKGGQRAKPLQEEIRAAEDVREDETREEVGARPSVRHMRDETEKENSAHQKRGR
jgi:hypothetical protein